MTFEVCWYMFAYICIHCRYLYWQWNKSKSVASLSALLSTTQGWCYTRAMCDIVGPCWLQRAQSPDWSTIHEGRTTLQSATEYPSLGTGKNNTVTYHHQACLIYIAVLFFSVRFSAFINICAKVRSYLPVYSAVQKKRRETKRKNSRTNTETTIDWNAT